MAKNRVEKYIDFIHRSSSPTGKTERWEVKGRSGTIGWIAWYGGWRKYVFNVADGCFFDHDCLRLISDFLKQATKDRPDASFRIKLPDDDDSEGN